MSSRMRGGRRGLAAVAGLVFTVGLALTGCDPTAADTATVAVTPPAAPVAATTPPPAAPVAPAPVVTTPAVAPVQTPPPAPEPTTVAPEPTKPAAQQAPTTAPPKAQPTPTKATTQPKATTAQPPTDPTPAETKPAATGDCEIKSNAGNCYKAGQFCRDADLGRTTHEAGGRVITCRMVSGKPHWQA